MSNPGTEAATGWASPEVIAAVVSFMVSGVISLFSLYLENKRFGKRRTDDRKYNAEVHLYQNIVVLNAVTSISMADQIDEIFNVLLADIDSKTMTPAKRRAHIEKAADEFFEVDKIYSKDIVSKSLLYSEKYAKNLETNWTDFYDLYTSLATKLSAAGNPKLKVGQIRIDKADAKEKFIRSLAQLTRDAHPVI